MELIYIVGGILLGTALAVRLMLQVMVWKSDRDRKKK